MISTMVIAGAGPDTKYGSTRWAMTATRLTTDGLPRLDVRALARAGGLAPGARATVTWSTAATITTEVPNDPCCRVILRYRARRGSDGWTVVDEAVAIAWTACTFGGSRPWLVCPGCGRRYAVLHGVAGWFRCRNCHGLAYASTRRS
jgi:hypothetical protein